MESQPAACRAIHPKLQIEIVSSLSILGFDRQRLKSILNRPETRSARIADTTQFQSKSHAKLSLGRDYQLFAFNLAEPDFAPILNPNPSSVRHNDSRFGSGQLVNGDFVPFSG